MPLGQSRRHTRGKGMKMPATTLFQEPTHPQPLLGGESGRALAVPLPGEERESGRATAVPLLGGVGVRGGSMAPMRGQEAVEATHEPLGTSNIQHPTPNRQSMAQLETIGCSILDVGCWMFSFGSGVQSAKFSGNSLYEPCNAAVPAASSRGVPPREGTRGGTPRKLAGGDVC